MKLHTIAYGVCFLGVLLIIAGSFIQTVPTTTTRLSVDTTKHTVDLIVFSYDRPLQLYAFLESVNKYLKGIESITVIFRTSSNEFDHAYENVKQAFPSTIFKQEHATPKNDFKSLLVDSFVQGKSGYIVFAVDDMIAKQLADLTFCTHALEQTGAYGFYLRLGTNLNYCYPLSCEQPLPPITQISSCVCSWTFKEGTCDWNYPNTVDMTIYRKQDIVAAVEKLNYRNPNTFDVAWSKIAHSVSSQQGLCFKDSVIINIPMNRVQQEHNNRYANTWSSEQLLALFESNLKIDISRFDNIKNDACHVAYHVHFVERNNPLLNT